MTNQQMKQAFLSSVTDVIASLDSIKADSKLHAFSGADGMTCGYYSVTPDLKEGSITVDYFLDESQGGKRNEQL
jgi:hypothetical protein